MRKKIKFVLNGFIFAVFFAGSFAAAKKSEESINVSFVFGSKVTRFLLPRELARGKAEYFVNTASNEGEKYSIRLSDKELKTIHQELQAFAAMKNTNVSQSCQRIYMEIKNLNSNSKRVCVTENEDTAKRAVALLRKISPSDLSVVLNR